VETALEDWCGSVMGFDFAFDTWNKSLGNRTADRPPKVLAPIVLRHQQDRWMSWGANVALPLSSLLSTSRQELLKRIYHGFPFHQLFIMNNQVHFAPGHGTTMTGSPASTDSTYFLPLSHSYSTMILFQCLYQISTCWMHAAKRSVSMAWKKKEND